MLRIFLCKAKQPGKSPPINTWLDLSCTCFLFWFLYFRNCHSWRLCFLVVRTYICTYFCPILVNAMSRSHPPLDPTQGLTDSILVVKGRGHWGKTYIKLLQRLYYILSLDRNRYKLQLDRLTEAYNCKVPILVADLFCKTETSEIKTSIAHNCLHYSA